MDMNGMMMDGGGGVSGTWINKNTNEVITVRDCIFEGEQMLIQTAEGRQISGEDFTSNYYQISDSNKDAADIMRQLTAPPKPDPLFEGLEELAGPEIRKPSPRPSRTPSAEITPTDLLDKIFKDCRLSYRLDVDLEDMPSEAVSVLIRYMNVTVDDIAEYLVKRLRPDKDDLTAQIKSAIENAAS